MAMLKIEYTVKPSSIGRPKVYLGDDVGKVFYGDVSYAWTMISYSYIKEAINNVKKRLKEGGLKYNKKLYGVNYFPKNPFSSVDYSPELDTSM